jgi:hypothetical protein
MDRYVFSAGTNVKIRFQCRVFAVVSGTFLSLLAAASEVAEEEKKKSSASHAVSFDYGVGYDTNPFLAPSESYYDQNSSQIVQPVAVSGLFSPFRLDGLMTTRHSFVSYHLNGDLYPDSETRNAENFALRVSTGLKFDFGHGPHNRSLKFGPYAVHNREVYFDRDTGLAGQSGGVDVSDRYEYRALGGETELDLEVNRVVDLSLEGAAERRDYERVEGIESFNQDIVKAAAQIDIRLARPASIYLGYGYQSRLYQERHARDLGGDSSDTHPPLKYSYAVQKAGIRFRNAGRWRLAIGWERIDRTDEYLGYNDYIQDRYKLRQTFGGQRWTLELFGGYRVRTFPTAFIFDNPTSPQDGTPNPRKAYERVESGFEVEIAWNHFRLVVGGRHDEQETTDPRFGYVRSRATIGGRWVY